MKQDTEVADEMLSDDNEPEAPLPNYEIGEPEIESKVENQSVLSRTTYPNLMRDETLILEIRNFPCLYDRSHPHYKKAESMNQAWNKIREKCPWIENKESVITKDTKFYSRALINEGRMLQKMPTVSGRLKAVIDDEAIRLFEVLKKRYSKKKMDYKRAHVSSGESLLTRKTKLELDKYSFMNWMEPYIRYRTTKIITEKVNKPNSNGKTDSLTYRNETLDERLGKYVGEYLDKQSASMAGSKRPLQVLPTPVAYPYENGAIVGGGSAIAGVVYYENQASVYPTSHPPQNNADINHQPHPHSLHHRLKSTNTIDPKRKRSADEIQQYTHSRQAPQQQRAQTFAAGSDEISNDSRNSTPAEYASKAAVDEGSRNNNSRSKKAVYETKLLKDEDELFAALIVSEMKNLNDRMKYIVKHRISNVLFDALTEQYASEKKEETKDGK